MVSIGSAAVVEEVIDRLRHRPVDPRHPLQVQHARLRHPRAEPKWLSSARLRLAPIPGT